MAPESLLRIVVGLALLTLGRKLFWLFVAAAGFLAGMEIGPSVVGTRESWLVLVIAIAAGLVGALLAIAIQKIAIAIAGFLAGGYVAAVLLRNVVAAPASWGWIPYLIGGVLGAILVLVVFDWALIVLSSVSGALLVTESLKLERSVAGLVFATLAFAGILIQARLLARTHPGD